MSGRRVVDLIDARANVVATRGGIVIDGVRVPLEDVGVVMLGSRGSVSGGALALMARYDVVLLNCDWRGVPDFVGYPWSTNSRVGTRHRAQAELSLPRRKAAWRRIVRAKILGQARNLEAAGQVEAGLRLREIRTGVRSGDPTNCEAHAARAYWRALFGPDFRRDPRFGVQENALLDYGYAVTRGLVIQGIGAAGLCPTYGLWHRHRASTFALADDLIEPFRPGVDYRVRQIAPGASLDDRQIKREIVSVVARTIDGSGRTIATAILDIGSALASYVEGGSVELEVPAWDPRVDTGEDTQAVSASEV